MKKLIAALTVLISALCVLSSCRIESYEDGYKDGYSDGYLDAECEMQYYVEEEFCNGYDYGYEDGYHDGREDGWFLEEEATHYAVENGGWHPEEAWEIINAYQNNKPFYKDGSSPSNQDYLDAIDSLIYFYDYFYSARYK